MSPASPRGTASSASPLSDVTVVLFGDSHAAQWFPALERLATERGWRLVSMTKSACTTADIDIWTDIVKRTYDECSRWREAALERMAIERPDLVVVSDSRGYKAMVDGVAVPIAKVRDRWDAASGRTLERLATLARHVVVIGDTPRAQADPPVCLSANLDDAIGLCAPVRRRGEARAGPRERPPSPRRLVPRSSTRRPGSVGRTRARP